MYEHNQAKYTRIKEYVNEEVYLSREIRELKSLIKEVEINGKNFYLSGRMNNVSGDYSRVMIHSKDFDFTKEFVLSLIAQKEERIEKIKNLLTMEGD